MQDLNSRSFNRTGRGHPNSLTVRPLCPKAQQMPAWRSCWYRHLTWCRRRRTGRRPRELERVPGAWGCRIHHPTTPRRTPLVKTRRRKKRPLPLQRGERRKGRPPQLGRLEGPRREGTFLRTTPPTPMTAKRSGHQGLSPWQNRKCPDTKITHGVSFAAQYLLTPNITLQLAQGRARCFNDRLPGFVGHQ